MSTPKNALEQKLGRTASEAGQPANEQDRIGYGIISEVNQETSQVKIKLLTSDGQPGEELRGGFLPLVTPLNVIHMLFGALREGLVCRIYWKGKLRPKTPLIEVIGDEEHSLLKKKPASNEVEVGPYQIFSGGLSL
jgi:hypothetical protein